MHAKTTTWPGIARRVGSRVFLENPLHEWDPEAYGRARMLLVDGRVVQGWLELPAAEVSEERLLAAFGPQVCEQPPPSSDAALTVAICSRDRDESLRACLDAIGPSLGPDDRLLIVDNAPRTDATECIVEEYEAKLPVDRVLEPVPGLSRARNAALRNAATDIVAFTDDDVLFDRHWLHGIRRGFSRAEDVVLVTGLVPAAELSHESQILFDSMLQWAARLEQNVFRLRDQAGNGIPMFPYSAGYFGTGANFAVKRQVLLDLGGFDEALGAGRRTRGGEDLEIFVRVLRAGYGLAFEPDSIVWHVHGQDLEALRRHVFGYGSGLTAYLTRLMLEPGRTDVIRTILRGRSEGVRNLRSFRRQLTPALKLQEIAGFAWGPIAYLIERSTGSAPSR